MLRPSLSTQTLGSNLFMVEDVPAQVCPQCGETYLLPEIADALQAIGQRTGAKPKRTLNVPVYRFTPMPASR